MNKLIPTQITSALLAFAMALPLGYAAKPALNATYKVVGSSSCQSNDVGFSDYPILGALGSNIQVFTSWEATMEFDDDGTVVETNHGQYALPQVLQQPVGTFESECNYTSTRNPDGTFDLIGACDGRVLSGVARNEKDHLQPAVWKVTPAPGMILLSRVGTQVETLSTDLTGTHYRICQGTAIGVKQRGRDRD